MMKHGRTPFGSMLSDKVNIIVGAPQYRVAGPLDGLQDLLKIDPNQPTCPFFCGATNEHCLYVAGVHQIHDG